MSRENKFDCHLSRDCQYSLFTTLDMISIIVHATISTDGALCIILMVTDWLRCARFISPDHRTLGVQCWTFPIETKPMPVIAQLTIAFECIHRTLLGRKLIFFSIKKAN